MLIHATDGGAGGIPEGFPATRDTFGAVRRAECEAAWRAVGGSPTGTSGSAIRSVAAPTAMWSGWPKMPHRLSAGPANVKV